MKYNLVTLLGPTAVGKTHLAVRLASSFGGEIISADSRQVYRDMDIGTGKDLQEYTYNQMEIKYHLINIVTPMEEYNLFRFKKDFYSAFNVIEERSMIPILTGGTGLYLNSVINNYNLTGVKFSGDYYNFLHSLGIPELIRILKSSNLTLHNTTDLNDKERLIRAIIVAEADVSDTHNQNIKSFNIGILMERDDIKKRITFRLKERLKNGMIEETQMLLNNGIVYEKLLFFGLEYKYTAQYIKGELNYNDMFQKLNSAIHIFAKKQMTWFRKMEREGTVIHWINGPDFESAKLLLQQQFFI